MPPRAEPVMPGAVVALGAVQGELDCRLGRYPDLDLTSGVLLGDSGIDEYRDLGPPFAVGADLARQSVVERPTGGAYMAGEVLPLSSGGVESEPECPELLGVGHGTSPPFPVEGRVVRTLKQNTDSRLQKVPTPPDGLPRPGGWRCRGSGGAGSWIPSVSAGAR